MSRGIWKYTLGFVIGITCAIGGVELLYGLRAQEVEEKLRLENATLLEGSVVNGVRVRYLTGNVEFSQGSSRMYCDRATEYIDQSNVIFTGNVKIFSDSRSLFADHVVYDQKDRISIARGNVRAVDSLRTLTSKRARYDDIKNTVSAFEDVVITDSENRLSIFGGKAEYHRDEGYALVELNPIVIRLDSSGVEEVRIFADQIELFEDGERLLAQGNVRIVREQMEARSGVAEFLRSDNLIRLQKQPTIQQRFSHLFGTEIDLLLHDKKIDRAKITGYATVTARVDTLSPVDDRIDLLLGEEIFIVLKGNRIDSVRISGRATSYYHAVEDSVYQGLNKSLGDSIIMKFKDGELARVRIKSTPGSTEGIYLPPGQDGLMELEIKTELERRRKAVTEALKNAQAGKITETLR